MVIYLTCSLLLVDVVRCIRLNHMITAVKIYRQFLDFRLCNITCQVEGLGVSFRLTSKTKNLLIFLSCRANLTLSGQAWTIWKTTPV